MTVSAKITQWEEGATSVSLDITIYQLITRLVAKVTQFLSYKFFLWLSNHMLWHGLHGLLLMNQMLMRHFHESRVLKGGLYMYVRIYTLPTMMSFNNLELCHSLLEKISSLLLPLTSTLLKFHAKQK